MEDSAELSALCDSFILESHSLSDMRWDFTVICTLCWFQEPHEKMRPGRGQSFRDRWNGEGGASKPILFLYMRWEKGEELWRRGTRKKAGPRKLLAFSGLCTRLRRGRSYVNEKWTWFTYSSPSKAPQSASQWLLGHPFTHRFTH